MSGPIGSGSIKPPTDPRDPAWPDHYDDGPTRAEAERDER